MLPKHDYFYQGFNYSFKNWLAFYWRGFSQTIRYSYVLEDISDMDQTFAGFSKNKRNNIRKAQKLVEVKQGLSCEEFYKFHKQSLEKEGFKVSYSYELFERIYDATIKKGRGEIFYAVDEKGEMHSGLFYVWDNVSAYSLISVIHPDHSSSNSLSLLFYEAIKTSSKRVTRFDFEGSMIKGVEAAYRNFGAKQIPYFIITKSNSIFLNLFTFLFKR
ncbi:FemAB family protein [compost metagenome]